MIKAIVFDCFGVLTTEAWKLFKVEHFGHNSALFEQASQISWRADRGLISYGDFIDSIAGLANITPAEFTRAIERNVPDEELFAYIRELKPDYKLGLLSNVASNYLTRIFNEEQLGLFDAIALSYRSGYIKPERQAFEIVAQQLEVGIATCIFVDDQERNVTGAKKAGMQAVLYKNVGQLRRDLGRLLGT